jgi:predicted DNA-binding protein (UPF0251 family)
MPIIKNSAVNESKMKISGQTFGRILRGAHKKVAECLLKGKALSIETKGKEK